MGLKFVFMWMMTLSNTKYEFLLYDARGVVSADIITNPLMNIATNSSEITVQSCADSEVNLVWIFGGVAVATCNQGSCTGSENFTPTSDSNYCYNLLIRDLNILDLTTILISRFDFATSQRSGAYITKLETPKLLSTVNELEVGSSTTLSCSVGYNGAIIPVLSWRMYNSSVLITENTTNKTTVTTRLSLVLSRNDNMKLIYCTVKFDSIGNISCGSGVQFCANNIPSYSSDHSVKLPIVRYPPDTVELDVQDNQLRCIHDGNIAENNTKCDFVLNNTIVSSGTSCILPNYQQGEYICVLNFYFNGMWNNLPSNRTYVVVPPPSCSCVCKAFTAAFLAVIIPLAICDTIGAVLLILKETLEGIPPTHVAGGLIGTVVLVIVVFVAVFVAVIITCSCVFCTEVALIVICIIAAILIVGGIVIGFFIWKCKLKTAPVKQ